MVDQAHKGKRSSPPVRLLSVIPVFRPAFSGEGEWWLRMVPLLQRRGIEAEILTPTFDIAGKAQTSEPVDGVMVHRCRIRGGPRARWGWIEAIMGDLIRRRRQFDIALFHAPNGDAVYVSCLLGGILGWKTVYKMTLFRSDDLVSIRDTGRLGRLRLSALRVADGFISISGPLTRTFEQTGLRPVRLLVVPQGVDTGRFRPADPDQKRAARARLGIPESARVALFCGSLIHRKGVDILVEAWRQVARSVSHALLLMVGPNSRDGLIEPQERPLSESIEHRTQEPALRGSVRLVGFQKEVEVFYAAADVFVFPSRYEGWASVVTEAMAAGLPCIISRLDGTAAEMLRSGDEGIIVGSEDPGEYAEQLVRLLTDAETARQMGERARKRAVELFEIERVADRYAGFLRSLLTECPSDVRELSGQWG